jgi:uncharacterized membrane protein HdeD (DUF308 family)
MTSHPLPARHAHGGLVLFNGLLLLLAGLFLAVFPFVSALAMIAAAGVYLVAAGAIGLFAAFRALGHGRSSLLAFVGPPLAMLIGVVFWLAPEEGLETVMGLAGALTLVAGVLQVAAALGLAGKPHWGLLLLNGVFTLLAGLAMMSAPAIAAGVFCIFFGVQLLFHGAHMARLGLRMRRLGF